MSDAVVVALIGLAGSLLGSLIGVVVSSKLTQYRLEQLEKKVDKHNNVVERMYSLEERVSIAEEKIKVENHRIDDLECFHKPT
jgi:ABC-type lipoprotein release transport system permease subunit